MTPSDDHTAAARTDPPDFPVPPLPLSEPVRLDLAGAAIGVEEERTALLRLLLTQDGEEALPAGLLSKLLRYAGGAEALLRQDAAALVGLGPVERDRLEAFFAAAARPEIAARAATEAGRLREGPVKLFGLTDAGYPGLLRFAPDPPPAVWVLGQWRPTDAVSIAVVGNSRASESVRALARRQGQALAQRGVTTINSGERGTDASALTGATEAGGRAVVALGAGLLAHGRHEQQRLYDRIADPDRPCGAMISTVWPQTPPDAGNLVAGDYLVAALSLATLVVRGRRNGGAMIAARVAAESDRPVLALPCEADDASGEGSLQLLRDGRARLADRVDYAIDAAAETARDLTLQHAQRHWLRPRFVADHPLGTADRIDRTIVALLQRLPAGADGKRIATHLSLDQSDVNRRLTRLALLGVAQYGIADQRFRLP